MKTQLFIVLALISFNAFSQKSYLELRKEYQQHCDSIVTDTIEEQGCVHYKINPKDNELKLVPKDTVWYERSCPQYKIKEWFSTSNISTWTGTTLSASAAGYVSAPTYSKAVETITSDISRFKYCQCKYKKGSQEDFWNWVDKKYLK